MALAVLLKTEQFRLATDRAVLKRDEVVAIENTIDLLHGAVAEADRIRLDAEEAARRLAEQIRAQGEAAVRDEVARAAAAAPVSAAGVLRQVEQAVVEIVAEAVTRLAASLDHRQILAQSIDEVGRIVGRRTFAVLKVAPADLAFAQQTVEGMMREARLPTTVAVRADPAVAAGDCVLLSDSGKLTLGLAQQLNALAHTVRATLSGMALPTGEPVQSAAPASEPAHE